MMYRSVGYRSTFNETKRALSKDIPESWPVLLLAVHTMTLRKGFEIEGFEVSAMGCFLSFRELLQPGAPEALECGF